MSFNDHCDLIRNLKGAPASILLALLLSGRTLTAAQLEIATNYTDKPIRKALKWLEPRGYVQHHGHNSGWSLGPNAKAPLQAALANLPQPAPPRHKPPVRLPQGPNRPATLHPQPQSPNGHAHAPINKRDTILEYQAYSQPHQLTDRDAHHQQTRTISPSADPQSRKISADPNRQSRNNSDQSRNNSDQARKNSAQNRKNSEANSDNLRPSPTDQINNNPDPDLSADQTPSDQITDITQDARKNSELALLLQRLEIRDPAYSRILHTGNTHLVLAWWWLTIEKPWLDNPTGWLIRRLDEQDQPPDAYLELAQAWLKLSPAERSDMRASSYVYGGLERYWRDRDLSRTALRIVGPIHRSGGFKIFDPD